MLNNNHRKNNSISRTVREDYKEMLPIVGAQYEPPYPNYLFRIIRLAVRQRFQALQPMSFY